MKKIIAIVGFLGLFASQALVSSAAYFNSDPIVRCETQITRTLQKGSENDDVYTLQQMLVNAGFLNARPNGYFGNQTVAAVRAFQANNGLRVTGSVGEATRNAINERLCDTDLIDNNYSYNYTNDSYGNGGYSIGTTYVGQVDPFVQVITPQSNTPTIYATPQDLTRVSKPVTIATSFSQATPVASTFASALLSSAVPALPSPSSQIVGTGIVYNPSVGYTYGIIPRSGSVTVSSPVANSVYNEGDTVNVRWSTDNLQAQAFSILLESSITGQKTTIAVVPGNSYSFVLTKELLDSVCVGTCNNNQQGSFKVTVTAPTTDIAGITSTLRAAVAPITVRRPFAPGKLSLTVSKTPVSSGELFKLYVNVPNTQFSDIRNGTYSLRIKSLCPSSVSVSLAGAACGQEIVIPFNTARIEQGIPVTLTNPTWYAQEVTFQIALFGPAGQVTADAEAKATVNAAPFSW